MSSSSSFSPQVHLPLQADADAEGHSDLARAPQPAAARRIRADDLFVGEQQIEIAHGESVYRLRQTSSGKLILTK